MIQVAGQPGQSLSEQQHGQLSALAERLAGAIDYAQISSVARSEQERTRAQHEELMAEEGYRLVRDTPLARVLPWRILEFQHG